MAQYEQIMIQSVNIISQQRDKQKKSFSSKAPISPKLPPEIVSAIPGTAIIKQAIQTQTYRWPYQQVLIFPYNLISLIFSSLRIV